MILRNAFLILGLLGGLATSACSSDGADSSASPTGAGNVDGKGDGWDSQCRFDGSSPVSFECTDRNYSREIYRINNLSATPDDVRVMVANLCGAPVRDFSQGDEDFSVESVVPESPAGVEDIVLAMKSFEDGAFVDDVTLKFRKYKLNGETQYDCSTALYQRKTTKGVITCKKLNRPYEAPAIPAAPEKVSASTFGTFLCSPPADSSSKISYRIELNGQDSAVRLIQSCETMPGGLYDSSRINIVEERGVGGYLDIELLDSNGYANTRIRFEELYFNRALYMSNGTSIPLTCIPTT